VLRPGAFKELESLIAQVPGATDEVPNLPERVTLATPPPATSDKDPLDVFISAKSEDLQYAQQVFDFLTKYGRKVFWSPMSLLATGNSDYRKEIDQKLENTKHMLVVTTDPKHVESGWVQHEWGSFCNEKRSGRKAGNLLTLVTPGILARDLPLGLRQYEVWQFESENFEKLLQYFR